MTNIATIDCGATKAPGFNWYVTKPFGYTATDCATDISLPSGGPLVITPSIGDQWTLATAAPISSSPYYVGSIFGGGWYVEAQIAFDDTITPTAGFPAFWAESAQRSFDVNGSGDPDHWPGQVSQFEHFAENDMFEYDITVGSQYYDATLIDWWGLYNVTCTDFCKVINRNNIIRSLSGIVWTNFNTVGQLWIPGTAENNWQGTIINYFNGVVVTSISWSGPPPVNPPPVGNLALSIIDQTNFIVILTSGTGGDPMSVRYVRVWQK